MCAVELGLLSIGSCRAFPLLPLSLSPLRPIDAILPLGISKLPKQVCDAGQLSINVSGRTADLSLHRRINVTTPGAEKTGTQAAHARTHAHPWPKEERKDQEG